MIPILQELAPYVFKGQLVGSFAINGEGEDKDIALRVEPVNRVNIINILVHDGFIEGGSGEDLTKAGYDFKSFKKGEYNILLCYDDESYQRFVKGKDYCIFLKNLGVDMSIKAVRIAIHSIVAGNDMETINKELERVGD